MHPEALVARIWLVIFQNWILLGQLEFLFNCEWIPKQRWPFPLTLLFFRKENEANLPPSVEHIELVYLSYVSVRKQESFPWWKGVTNFYAWMCLDPHPGELLQPGEGGAWAGSWVRPVWREGAVLWEEPCRSPGHQWPWRTAQALCSSCWHGRGCSQALHLAAPRSLTPQQAHVQRVPLSGNQ